MTDKTFACSSDKDLNRFKKYQLPHSFKKIGFIIFAVSFVSLFINAFTINHLIFRESVKYGILLGLLITSISKEKIEDELIIKLRMQSYTFAFIAGVAFSLFQPFINFFVDSIVNPEKAMLKDSGDFEILWILLFIQVFYFEALKKRF